MSISERLKEYICEIENEYADLSYNEKLHKTFLLMMSKEDYECVRLFGKNIYDLGKESNDQQTIEIGKDIKNSATLLIAKLDQMKMEE